MGKPSKCDHNVFERVGRMSGESGMAPDCLVEKALRLLAEDASYIELVRTHQARKEHIFKKRVE
jgi:hypothetical protein